MCPDPLTAILVFHFKGLRAAGQSVLAQVFQQSLWFAHDPEASKATPLHFFGRVSSSFRAQ